MVTFEQLISNLPELDSVLKVVQIGFYIITPIIAGFGLSTWKRQTKGAAEYELAKMVLTGCYRVRDAIEDTCSPMITSSEFADRVVSEVTSETRDQTTAMNHYHAYRKRFMRVRDEAAELYPHIIEAEALLGKDASESVRALFKLMNKLRVAIEMYFQNQAKGDLMRDTSEVFKKFQNMVYGLSRETNPSHPDEYDDDGFKQEMKEALEKITRIFSPYITSFHTRA